VGVVKRRVLRGLWRRLVGVGIIGPGLLGAPTLRFTPSRCCRVFLMYTPNTLTLYIRHTDMSILSSAAPDPIGVGRC
jgi:hypothetical protein